MIERKKVQIYKVQRFSVQGSRVQETENVSSLFFIPMTKLNKGIGVVGSITIDKVVAEDHTFLKLGGVATYAGITYRRHGLSCLIVSNLAEQELELIKQFKAECIDVCRGATDRTTHFVNYIHGNHRRQELLQQARPIEMQQIQAIVEKVDALHLGALHPFDIEPSALRLLCHAGLPTFLDVQGYTRVIKNKKVHKAVSGRLSTALTAARMVKADKLELQSILDFYQINLADLINRFQIEEFVVTLGENGGYVQTPDGKTFNYAAEPAGVAVDPTGAGDVFFAAYVVGRFFYHLQIPDACRDAARIAARQVKGDYITLNQIGLE